LARRKRVDGVFDRLLDMFADLAVEEISARIERVKASNFRPKINPIDRAYAVIGASPDDSMDVIEAVYKAKAKFFHPDKGGDAEKFKRLQAAIEMIRKERRDEAV